MIPKILTKSISCLHHVYLSFYNMILNSYTYKIFLQQISKFCLAAVFSVSGRTGRPARSTGACVRTCTLVHVCRPTAGSTDCKQSCSLVFWVDRPVDRLQKIVFSCRGRSTGLVDRSPTASASRANGRPDRSTARPAKCQRLFPLWCNLKICFYKSILADLFRFFGDLFQIK